MSIAEISTTPSLDGLPVTVTEFIASILEFKDLCSLRLTSRDFAAKSSQGCYMTYFRCKTIDRDNAKQLEDLMHFPQHDSFKRQLEDLTLLRTVPTNGDKNAEAVSNSGILGGCFKNLRSIVTRGCLQSLSLEVWTRDEDGGLVRPDRDRWETTWAMDGSLHRDTMAALHESQLPIKSLAIFGKEVDCSLGFEHFASDIQQSLPLASFAALESLSLSLSRCPDRATETKELQISESRAMRLEALLQLCPQLKTFEIHWFNIWPTSKVASSTSLLAEQHFFGQIAASVSFRHLTALTLRGIHCTASSLQVFLKTSFNLQIVDLQHVHLTSGSFRPIFDYLSDQSLEYHHLDALYETDILCFAKTPGKPHMSRSKPDWPNELTRHGKEASQHLSYQIVKGRTKASPRNWIYYKKCWLEYGPLLHGDGTVNHGAWRKLLGAPRATGQ